MYETDSSVTRRDFIKSAVAVGVTLGAAKNIQPQSGSKASPGRVIGASDKINVAVIGVGARVV